MQDWSGEGTGPVIFREDAEVSGVINGSAAVMAGATLQLTGMVTGDLAVEFGGKAIVHGTVRGAIRNRGGHVHLFGAADAVVDAAAGAVTISDEGAFVKKARE